MRTNLARRAFVGVMTATATLSCAAGKRQTGWSSEFAPRGVLFPVSSLNVAPWQGRDCLFVGRGEGLAQWHADGTWTWLNSGLHATVLDLAEFDDGIGTRLYSASACCGPVRAWDGQQWVIVGANGPTHACYALTVFDDGAGPALFVGMEGPHPYYRYHCLWKWDGIAWTPVAEMAASIDATPAVYSLAVHADRNSSDGPQLYVGGRFSSVNGVSCANIARWNGQTWTDLQGGVWHLSGGTVHALEEYDEDGGGPLPPALFAGGHFELAGAVWATALARWDGAAWSSVGEPLPLYTTIKALHAHDDGGGPQLYIGGDTYQPAGTFSRFGLLAAWNGQQFTLVERASVDGGVLALETFTDLWGRPALYVGGEFAAIGDDVASNIARYQDGQFFALTGGNGIGATGAGEVLRLVPLVDSQGPALYACGLFQSAGGFGAAGVARWDGFSWSSPAPANRAHNEIWDVAVFDEPAGRRLFVGGQALWFDGDPNLRGLVRWDGNSWDVVGGGLEVPRRGAARSWAFGALALEVFDDGRGPALYAAGEFSAAGGVPVRNIARWDGIRWEPLGGGLGGLVTAYPLSGSVLDLAAFDDGRGLALYAAGWFRVAGDLPANNIARWDGFAWEPLGTGLREAGAYPTGWRMVVHDDGSGPALYVGGAFAQAGGVTVNSLGRWNGAAWSSVGGGMTYQNGVGAVYGLCSFDDGRGPALVAMGQFDMADGQPIGSIARWDGTDWSEVGDPDVIAFAAAAFEDARGPALYVGGAFGGIRTTEGYVASSRIARYGCLDTKIPGDLDCDGVVSFFDIEPFIAAILDPAAYESTSPNCRIANGDLNADGQVNFFDIDPFVACIFGSCP